MAADLADDYRASGFNRRLGFGARPALLVVDFVKAYLTPGNPLYAGVEPALAAATTLVTEARAAAVPVIYTQVHYEEGDVDRGPFFRKAGGLANFVGANPAGDICDEIAPREGELVIVKQFASAFFDTSLRADLTGLGVDSVLICGLSTSGCVRASALDAVQSGFVPIVVREAVGDRAVAPHEASLFDLDAKYADVVSLDEAVGHLRGLAQPS